MKSKKYKLDARSKLYLSKSFLTERQKELEEKPKKLEESQKPSFLRLILSFINKPALPYLW